jgi:hypothetical protein
MEKVRVNSLYTFDPCLWDQLFPTGRAPKPGSRVKVVNKFGCPKANTMGHCYIEDPETKCSQSRTSINF